MNPKYNFVHSKGWGAVLQLAHTTWIPPAILQAKIPVLITPPIVHTHPHTRNTTNCRLPPPSSLSTDWSARQPHKHTDLCLTDLLVYICMQSAYTQCSFIQIGNELTKTLKCNNLSKEMSPMLAQGSHLLIL